MTTVILLFAPFAIAIHALREECDCEMLRCRVPQPHHLAWSKMKCLRFLCGLQRKRSKSSASLPGKLCELPFRTRILYHI